MQAELFKQNAILMTNDIALNEIYGDLLSLNGYSLICCYSISEVIRDTDITTELLILDLDNEDMSIVNRAVRNLKEKFQNLQVIGLSVHSFGYQQNKIGLLDSFLVKPIHLDNLIETVFKNDKQNDQLCISA